MELKESKSDNNIIPIDNLVNSFTKDFKKCFNSIKYQKNNSSNKKNNNKKDLNIPKRQSKSIILEQNSNNKTIHKDSNPIEFYYEFQDFIDKEKIPKKSSKEKIQQIPVTERKTIKNKKIGKIQKRQNSDEKKDLFWEKVKYYMKVKDEHLNELTYRLKMKKEENCEENKTNKKLNKTAFLLSNKKRKPLYYYRNINENSLSKNFNDFYKYFQKEQKNDIKCNTTRLCKNKKLINELNTNNISFIYSENYKDKNKESSNDKNKYKIFYEKKMNWIKKRDEKINKERNEIEQHDKYVMNSFSFKPIIDKNSKQLMQKRNDFINFMENQPYIEKNYQNMMINKQEIYQKYVATIKPFMSFYYEKNSPFYKKNNSFTKRRLSVDIGMIHIKKGKNIRIIREKDINNSNNDKSVETNNKSNVINRSKIFNMFKPDKKYLSKNKKENDKKIDNEIINENRKKNKIRQKIWWNEIKDKNFNKHKDEEKKYDPNNLYKVNVRDNCSWNKICINKVVSKKRDKNVINELLGKNIL